MSLSVASSRSGRDRLSAYIDQHGLAKVAADLGVLECVLTSIIAGGQPSRDLSRRIECLTSIPPADLGYQSRAIQGAPETRGAA